MSFTGFSRPVYLESGKVNLDSKNSIQTNSEKTPDQPVLIQFNSTTSREYRESLEDLVFHEYIPENTWLSTSNLTLSEIESIDKVEAAGIYRASYRKDSSLDLSRTRELKVSTIRNISEEKIKKFGEVLGRIGSETWKLKVNKSSGRNLISQNFIRKVERPEPPLSTFNLESRRLVGADTVKRPPYNLTGIGFTAAVWDKGWAGKHIDLNQSGKRVVGDDGKACGGCEVLEHGTHVAGTLLGSGVKNSDYTGFANGSRLLTFEWPGSDSGGNYSVDYIEETENEVNRSIEKYSAVVSQNSWGYTNGAGDYFGLSEVYDDIISGRNPNVDGRLTTVFSVGNIRDNVSRDYNTTFPPATAKNVIAVGAVDDNGSMTSYSSWGPTDDGRIKPDLVADGGCGSGTYVTSTVPGNSYSGKCGTSMAAPAVSGGVILLTQEFNRTFGRKPQPATVKGILVQTAQDLYTEGPDYRTGWGLLDVKEAIRFTEKSSHEDLVRKGSLGTGENDTYTIRRSENSNLEITLVWDDPKSSTGTKTLVNDLDLTVENSKGEKFQPWTMNFSTRSEGAFRGEDHRNNVEQVLIKDSNSSKYNITVEGWSIPKNPQNYSLILNQKVDNTKPTAEIKSPVTGNYSGRINLSATWQDNYSKIVNASVTAGRSRKVTRALNTTLNSSILQDGVQTLTYRFKDSAGNEKILNRTVTVDNTPPEINASIPEFTSHNLSLAASIKDQTTQIAQKTVKIKNSSFEKKLNFSNQFNTEKVSDGNYSIVYSYSDTVGNTENQSYIIEVDNTDPVINIKSPENKVIQENLTVNTSIIEKNPDTENIAILRNLTELYRAENSLRLDSSNISEGNYTLSFEASDDAGNNASRKINLSYNTRPSINVLSPDRNFYGNTPDINVSTDKQIDDVVLSDGTKNYSTASNRTYFYNTSLDGQNGSNSLKAYLLEGNLTWTENLEYFLDRKAPEFKLREPEKMENISAELNFSLENISEATEITSVNISAGNYSKKVNTTSGLLNISDIEEGVYNLSLDVSDRFENKRKASRKIRVDRKAPSLEIKVSNTSYINSSLTINASSYDNSSGVSNLSYTLRKDNFTVEGRLNTSLNTSDIPDGNYTLEIISRDYAGNLNTSSRYLIIDTRDPEIENVEPRPGTTLQTETSFNISFTDLSGIKNTSQVETTSGNLENLRIRERQIITDISGLNPGESFEVELEIIDLAGNSLSKKLGYSVRDEETGSSSGTGSSSSTALRSFTSTENTTEKNENTSKASMNPVNRSRNQAEENTSEIKFKPGKTTGKIQDKSPVKTIDLKSSRPVSASVKDAENNFEPPQNTESLDEFNFSVNTSITSVNLTFEVSKDSINRSQVGNISLYRRNSSRWQKLNTSYINSSREKFLFKSQVPGFSPFTVALSENSSGEKPLTEAKNSTNRTVNRERSGKQQENTLTYLNYSMAFITVLLLAYVLNYWRDRRKIESQLENLSEMTSSPENRAHIINSRFNLKQGRTEYAKKDLEKLQDGKNSTEKS